MKLLITGCGGFIGSHFLDRILARENVEVIGWDGDSTKISHLLGHRRLTFRQRYLHGASAFAAFEEDVAGCDWVINMAAICNPARYNTEPLNTIQTNFLDSYPVIEMAAAQKKRLVHFSTSEVYGRTVASYLGQEAYNDASLFMLNAETTPMIMGPIQNQRWTYAAAKQLLERFIYAHHQENGLEFAVIRPFNFFGPRMDYLPGIEGEGKPRVLPIFVSAMLRGLPMQLVDGGHARRTITSIHDAIDALVAIVDRPETSLGHFYNIGNPDNEVSMRELAEATRRAFARVTGQRHFLDHPIETVDSLSFYGSGYEDCDRRLMDITQERARLNWAPKHGLNDLLDEIVTFYWAKYGQRLAQAV
jgi:UDP-apiose/xylose synthase